MNLLNEASLEQGGPDNIAVSVENPTLDTSAIMMKHKDIHLLVATGGPGVVTAVLSSGREESVQELVTRRHWLMKQLISVKQQGYRKRMYI